MLAFFSGKTLVVSKTITIDVGVKIYFVSLNSCSLYLSLLLVCLAAFSGPALVGGLEEGPVPDSLPISRKVILLNIQVTFPFLAGKNKTVLVLQNITVYNLSALTEIIYILQQFYVQKLC